MRRAALVLIFLTAAVAARPAPSADLNRRAGRLLRDIRAASLSAAKPVAALRGRLTALTAENAAAPDRDATRRLRLADGNLRLLDAGLPLPPPGPDEVPDPGAALAPPPPSRAPDLPPATFRAAAGAEMPSGARALFDGAETAGADPAPVAARPTGTFAGATLDDYAGVRGDAARRVLLKGAAKRILAGIRRADPGDRAAAFMAERLLGFLSRHRLRAEFSGLSFDVSEGGRLRLSYRLKSGAEGSEDLGNLEDWLSETGGGRGARGVRSKGGGAKRGKSGKGGEKGAATGAGGGRRGGKRGGGGKTGGGRGGAAGGGRGGKSKRAAGAGAANRRTTVHGGRPRGATSKRRRPSSGSSTESLSSKMERRARPPRPKGFPIRRADRSRETAGAAGGRAKGGASPSGRPSSRFAVPDRAWAGGGAPAAKGAASGAGGVIPAAEPTGGKPPPGSPAAALRVPGRSAEEALRDAVAAAPSRPGAPPVPPGAARPRPARNAPAPDGPPWIPGALALGGAALGLGATALGRAGGTARMGASDAAKPRNDVPVATNLSH